MGKGKGKKGKKGKGKGKSGSAASGSYEHGSLRFVRDQSGNKWFSGNFTAHGRGSGTGQLTDAMRDLAWVSPNLTFPLSLIHI